MYIDLCFLFSVYDCQSCDPRVVCIVVHWSTCRPISSSHLLVRSRGGCRSQVASFTTFSFLRRSSKLILELLHVISQETLSVGFRRVDVRAAHLGRVFKFLAQLDLMDFFVNTFYDFVENCRLEELWYLSQCLGLGGVRCLELA